MSKYDTIEEVTVAKTFAEILKFNPYHDSKGRFATANSAASFTYAPGKSKAHDNAIAREKERHAAAAAATSGLPEAVLKTCREVEAKTVNRKTEKMTLVGEDGRIILEKGGGKTSVSFGPREGYFMDSTTTLTHNHPGEYGGTFSGADVKVFVDYKLKAIRAVGKEGTYSLERTSQTNGNKSYDFKQEFASKSNALNSQIQKEYKSLKNKVARGQTTADEANKQLSARRTDLCNQQHEWLIQNAEKYGYKYVFEPSSGGVGKMYDGILKADKDEIEETGEVVLDGEFMSGDNWMIK